jgi:hypothetical protein
VHRDIKAANVMREEGGRIVLMDFSSVVEAKSRLNHSNDSSTHGTPFYMAPELFEDGVEATKSSDIYAVGVLLYRLVTGRYPVEAENLAELHEKLDQGGATLLLDARPDLPVGFVEVIDRALDRDPKNRFATAGEMEQALAAFAHAEIPTPEPLPRRRPRKVLWTRLAAAAVVVLIVATAIWILRPPPLTVEAELFRRWAEGDERLESGDRLAVGDRLFLEVSGSQPIHAYVLNEDRFGRRHRLFPLDGLVLANPLEPGVRHRLPGALQAETTGDGTDLNRYWQVDTGGGEETLMLIASGRPLANLEARLAEISPTGQTAEPEEGQLRGIGRVVPGPGGRPELSLEDLRAELEDEHGKDVEIWQIRLGNPSADNG